MRRRRPKLGIYFPEGGSIFPALDSLNAAGKVSACWIADDADIGALSTWPAHYVGLPDMTGATLKPTIQTSASHSKQEALVDLDNEHATFSALSFTGPFTFIGVFASDNDDYMWSDGTTNNRLHGTSGLAMAGSAGGTTVGTISTTSPVSWPKDGTYIIQSFGRDSSDDWWYWRDSVDRTHGTQKNAAGTLSLTMWPRGHLGGALTMHGKYAALCWFNEFLSANDRGNVEAELNTYYGLGLL